MAVTTESSDASRAPNILVEYWGAKRCSPSNGPDGTPDPRSQRLFWTLALGRRNSPAAPPKNKNLRPIPEQYAYTSASVVASHARPDSIPLTRLDPALQAYFVRMQRVANTTMNPAAVQAEAAAVADAALRARGASVTFSAEMPTVDEMSIPPTPPPRKCTTVFSLVREMLIAALEDIVYTRSVAMLIYGTLGELMLRLEGWGLRMDLEEQFVTLALAAFESSWNINDIDSALMTESGVGSVPETHQHALNQMLNIAALLGDLAGLSLITPADMQKVVSVLFNRTVVGTLRCRALYLFLLRGGASASGSHGMLILRAALISRARQCCCDQEMERRWFIEMIHVVDRSLNSYDQYLYCGPENRWDKSLDIRKSPLLDLSSDCDESDKNLLHIKLLDSIID